MNGNEFILTFDIDWAPDAVIDAIAAELSARKVKVTWFITHDSPAIRRLSADPLFELGLHPNYLPASTHGSSPREVMDYLLRIAPDAVSVRSHAVVQSGPLLNFYADETAIRIDSTIFLPEMPHIRPVVHLSPGGQLLRVPFFWADDYECCKPTPGWNLQRYIDTPGLKVMMFHPIHIALNSTSFVQYQDWKQKGSSPLDADAVGGSDLTAGGTRTFFHELTSFLAGRPVTFQLRDLLAG